LSSFINSANIFGTSFCVCLCFLFSFVMNSLVWNPNLKAYICKMEWNSMSICLTWKLAFVLKLHILIFFIFIVVCFEFF
jgi:hypothetical protein